MHIVVCIKQVPDSTHIRVHPVTNTIMRQGVPAIINPYDLFAIEAALRLETPYIPHITVSTSADHAAARKLAQALNQGGIDISGHIDALEVERRSGDVVRKVADAPLARAGWFG